jgi:hypothetical protein
MAREGQAGGLSFPSICAGFSKIDYQTILDRAAILDGGCSIAGWRGCLPPPAERLGEESSASRADA